MVLIPVAALFAPVRHGLRSRCFQDIKLDSCWIDELEKEETRNEVSDNTDAAPAPEPTAKDGESSIEKACSPAACPCERLSVCPCPCVCLHQQCLPAYFAATASKDCPPPYPPGPMGMYPYYAPFAYPQQVIIPFMPMTHGIPMMAGFPMPVFRREPTEKEKAERKARVARCVLPCEILTSRCRLP